MKKTTKPTELSMREAVRILQSLWACNEAIKWVKRQGTPQKAWQRVLKRDRDWKLWLLQELRLMEYGSSYRKIPRFTWRQIVDAAKREE